MVWARLAEDGGNFSHRYNGKTLRGEELQKQLDKWVRAGTIEMSCGAAIAQVADAGSAWLDLHKKYASR